MEEVRTGGSLYTFISDLFPSGLVFFKSQFGAEIYLPDESKGRLMSFDVHLSVRGVQ